MPPLKYLSIYFLLLLFGFCTPPPEKEVVPDPNIILIMSDDQGWGDLSMNGNPYIHTPNIDAMAENGVKFDRFYVSPVCSPTRAELLTGRYHVRGGVYDTGAGGERLDLDEMTFAQELQKHGYATAAYGKWHNGMQYPYHPNARGFDDFYGFCSGHWGNYYNPMLERNGKIVKGDGFIIDDLTGKAMEFIDNQKDRPFFLYLPFNTPHSPMQVPDAYWEKFSEKPLDKEHRYSSQEIELHTKAAYAMCENIDWNVGRIMNKLKELKLEENTIVMYLSDNGPNGARWNADMKGRKGSTDEGGVRSPLVVQWKGKIENGRQIDQIAGAIDLFPTFLELVGIQKNEEIKPIDGISLVPLLLNREVEWEDRTIVSHWNQRTSIRNQRFRLDHENKLFDIEIDQGQRIDVSITNPDVYDNLLQVKEKWLNEVFAELPEVDHRTFPIGHPNFIYTQLPARDANVNGNILRSNKWPNCSYFTNWLAEGDEISWDVEVLEEGFFEVTIYYTCSEADVGSTVWLNTDTESFSAILIDAHDPPLIGAKDDRFERVESYVKDFKPWEFGNIRLDKGSTKLVLKASDIPGKAVMDFRLMMLRRIS